MADLYTPQTLGALDGTKPPVMMDGALMQAKVRSIRALINLASLTITTADNVLLGRLPKNARFMFGMITHSVTMGASAALAIGTNKTHASNGQYRAAAVSTGVNAPALFGVAAARHAADVDTETPIYLTVGVADLPTSGLLGIDIFYSVAA